MAKFEEGIAAAVRSSVLDDIFRANRLSNGEIFYVCDSADPDFGKVVERYGKKRVFTDVQTAHDNMTSNRNDICFISGYTEHVLSAMWTITKSRCHFIGIGVGNRRYGLPTKITMPVTTAATDVFAVKNFGGTRNTFMNIKFINNNTVAQNIGCFGEGAEYTNFVNCEFYDSTDLNSDTHAELILNGDSTQFSNCTIGSLADAVSGNHVRPGILLTKGTVGAGLVCRDVLFDNCRFWKQAGGTTTAMVKSTTATDVERVMEFHDCQFVANPLGSTPAVAIACAATLTVGMIILTGDTCAFNCTKIATATGVFSGLTAKVATATIGLQAS